MHTSTAVVATEIKEVAAVVRAHDIGEILGELTVDELASTLNTLLKNPERLAECKANCMIAAQTENWENETKILAKIYPTVDK